MTTGAVLLFALLPPWGGATPLTVDATPRKAILLPAEPLVAEVRFVNPTNQAIWFDLGPNGIGAFHVTVREADGQTVRTSTPIRFFGGMHGIGRFALPPGGRRVESLVLNRWVSTRLPPGRYRVTVHVRPVDTNLGRFGLADGDPGPVPVRADLSFSITIEPPDEAALAALFDDLRSGLLGRHLDSRERNVRWASLFETDAPAAVGALSKLALHPKPAPGEIRIWGRDGTRLAALETLSRLEAAEAVRTLAKAAAAATEGSNEYRYAVGGVYRLHDTTDDPAVKAACQRVMKRFPRERIPVIAD